MADLVLPVLGIGEDSKSRTQAFSSVLIIDVKSASGLKNKALMGKSSPHMRITVPGATPEYGSTQEIKSDLDPNWNETMVFLMVPGADSFGIKIMCPGKLTGWDELGSVSVKVESVLSQTELFLDVVPQGKVTLGVQLLPLAETMWMPAALSAERKQREFLVMRGNALEKSLSIYQERCEVLEKAMEAEASEKEAAKESLAKTKADLEAAAKDASDAKTSMDSAEERMKFLETQTADAKAQAAMDTANKKVNEYIDNSKVVLTSLLANASEALSGVKSSLMSAVGMDKDINACADGGEAKKNGDASEKKDGDASEKKAGETGGELEPTPPKDKKEGDGNSFRNNLFGAK